MAHLNEVGVFGIRFQPPVTQARGPAVEVAHSENDGHKQQPHQWQSLHRSFELAADRHAPHATREVLNHKKCHAAQRDAQPQHEAEKIRMEELIASGWQNRRNQRSCAEQQSHPKRPLMDRIHDLRCSKFGIG